MRVTENVYTVLSVENVQGKLRRQGTASKINFTKRALHGGSEHVRLLNFRGQIQAEK